MPRNSLGIFNGLRYRDIVSVSFFSRSLKRPAQPVVEGGTIRDRNARRHIDMLDAITEIFSLEGPGRLRDLQVLVSFMPSGPSRLKCEEEFCFCGPNKRLPFGEERAVDCGDAIRQCPEVGLGSLRKINISRSGSARHSSLPCVFSNWGEDREIPIAARDGVIQYARDGNIWCLS
jgi:hypothetical protein